MESTAAIGRPGQVDRVSRRLVVLDILEPPEIGPFTKDDGEVVIDAAGNRLR